MLTVFIVSRIKISLIYILIRALLLRKVSLTLERYKMIILFTINEVGRKVASYARKRRKEKGREETDERREIKLVIMTTRVL